MTRITYAEIAEKVSVLPKSSAMTEEEVEKTLAVGWTPNLLAAASGITARYLRRLAKEGKLPGIQIGGHWVVQREAGDNWLAKRDIYLVEE